MPRPHSGLDENIENLSMKRAIALHFDRMQERTITVNGFSKAYAITGWRLGYLTAPPEILKLLLKIQSHSVSSATTFVQYGGLEALQGPQDSVKAMVDRFKVRRDVLVDGLNKMGLECKKPDGAFYAFANVSEYGNGTEVAEMLLREAQVAVPLELLLAHLARTSSGFLMQHQLTESGKLLKDSKRYFYN